MNRKINKIFVILMCMFLFISSNVYAIEPDKNIDVTEKTVDTVETSSNNMFTDFKEINKEDFIKIIDEGLLTSIGKNGTTLYAITNANEKFYIKDSNADLVPYITLKGYEISAITVPEIAPGTNTQAAQKTNQITGWFMMGGMITLFIVLYSRRRDSSRIPVVSGDSSSNSNKKTDSDIPTVKFEDVEGVEELKNDVFRLVDCLKNPEKYEAIGARTPKGVILYGPPGTGKTLLAKAIAGEAGVPFFSAVGSDFVEMYVGVGAKRVRELYKKAKQKAPCIVFIDEVDAVAAQRGRDNNSEADQTINALLAELDGFSSNSRVITICATNRLDMLDNAFKRAGRFDLKLAVGLPDKESRKNILAIHAKNKKLDDSVSLDVIANKTSGFSGAELEALLNEAAMSAVGKGRSLINNDDIEDAFFKIVMQGNKKPRKEITEMHKLVAWHEAGHTLATKLLTNDSVPSVTIIGSSSGAGGVTFRTPKDEGLQSKKYLKSLIGVMYAGRAAEEIYHGNSDLITTGASQDIKQATSIIKEYLALYGMGDLGMLDVTQLRHDFEDIMEEASKLAKEIYDSTLKVLTENGDTLKKLAEALLEKETLNENEIDEIIFGVPVVA